MRWLKAAAFLGVLGVALLGLRATVTHLWPEGPVTVRVPPSAWPTDQTGVARLEALRRAVEPLRGLEWLRPYTEQGTLPPTPPPGGWPRHPELNAPLDALAAVGGLDLPPPKLEVNDPPEILEPGLRDVMRAGRLRRVRALEHFRAGRYAEAGEDLGTCLRLAHVLQHAGGGLTFVMAGVALEERTLGWFEQMRRLAPEGQLGRALRPLLARASWPSVVARGLALECLAAERLLLEPGTLAYDGLTDAEKRTAQRVPPSWLFSRKKTRALGNQRCNALIATMLSAPASRTWPEFETLAPKLTRPGAYLDNPTGRVLLDVVTHSHTRKYAEREDAVRAHGRRILASP